MAAPRWASRFTASSSRRNRRRRTDRASQRSLRFNRPAGGAALRPRRSRQHLNLQRSCGVVRRQRAALAERWTRRTERVRRTPPRAPRGNFVGVARTDTSFSDAPHPIRLLRSYRERPYRRGATEKRNELAHCLPRSTGPGHRSGSNLSRPARVFEALSSSTDQSIIELEGAEQADQRHCWLLRVSGRRPADRCTPKKRNERTPLHNVPRKARIGHLPRRLPHRRAAKMSALGQKQTFAMQNRHVRFAPNSADMCGATRGYPLCANSGQRGHVRLRRLLRASASLRGAPGFCSVQLRRGFCVPYASLLIMRTRG